MKYLLLWACVVITALCFCCLQDHVKEMCLKTWSTICPHSTSHIIVFGFSRSLNTNSTNIIQGKIFKQFEIPKANVV